MWLDFADASFHIVFVMNPFSALTRLALILIIVASVFDATRSTSQDQPSSRVSLELTIEIVGVLRLNGTELDLSGLANKLEDGSPANLLGGFSAIEYSKEGDRFLVLPDRGAGDGAVSYPCRFHEMDLTVDPKTKTIHSKLVETKFFKSPFDDQLVGSLTALDDDLRANDAKHWIAFDPEGIRQLNNGSLIVSDEYGPRVVIANRQGRLAAELPASNRNRLQNSIQSKNNFGAFPNRGLEGIAVTPSNETMIAVFQSALVQDGEVKDDKCYGINCRWLVYDANQKLNREIVYQLDDLSSGVSEILAIDEHRFLVLERDGEAGSEAKIKKIFIADIQGASDVSKVQSLPPNEVPENLQAVQKSLFLDLLDERFGLGGELAAEKPEGLSWGPTLEDGRRTLWLCCDNDFDATKKSEIYCFAIDGL